MSKICLVVAFAALLAAIVMAKKTDNDHWEEFKRHHGKWIAKHEEGLRKELFNRHKAIVDAHNRKFERGEVSFKRATNFFSIMTEEEKSKYKGGIFSDADNEKRSKRGIVAQTRFNSTSPIFYKYGADNITLPTSVVNNLTPLEISSCWAFSSSTVMSYYIYNKTKTNYVFSPQHLVDCAGIWGAKGCNGGSPAQAFEYIQINKQTIEPVYPYKGVLNSCVKATSSLFNATGFVQMNRDTKSLLQAVAKLGPVSVAVHADPLMDYAGGIWDGTDPIDNTKCDPTLINHAVTIVGYGTDSTTKKDYWIIKNSWGTGWGENGYFRMARTDNLCGILQYTYALI